ncbi:MAG: EAL domain-containing protein, partial [Solirubrobacterales bacterium]
KIDRAFAPQAEDREHRLKLLRAVMELSQALDLQAVAEGIEHPEQLRDLERLGVQLVQGYLISRPLPAAAADQMVRSTQAISTSPRARALARARRRALSHRKNLTNRAPVVQPRAT